MGDKVLFDNIDFLIHSGDKIGLVGKNGSGKTTLFEEIYNNKDLIENKNLRISYLKQVINEKSNVLEFILDINKPEDWFDQEKNENRKKVEQIAEKLNFDVSLFERPLDSLSGGEKTKAFILKVMLQNPDFLILDEPTNHLDLDGMNYLEDWLNNQFKGAYIIVSHNRNFLNKVTNRIFDIFNKKLTCYQGNYEKYKEEKEKQMQKQLEKYGDYKKDKKRLEKTIQEKKQKKDVIDPKLRKLKEEHKISGLGYHKALDNISKIDKEIEQLKRRKELKATEKPFEDTEKINLQDFEIEKSYNEVLTLRNLKYLTLFKDVNLEIKRGQRVCIMGKNGCGKTTLLKLIINELKPTSGNIEIGKNTKIGYLKQNLDKIDISIWDYLKKECKLVNEQNLRDYLGKFLFRKNDIYKKMSELSGGELTRLELLKLVLNRCNFLLLDEPTNNLDIESIETLESALNSYQGTILFVSHDIKFIKNVGAEVYELGKKGLENKSINNLQ